VYTIAGFLDKNRDVMQDQLFEYMRTSTSGFIRSVTKFQNMLEQERKTVMAAKTRRASTPDEKGMTNKVGSA
jgi:myosin-7